MGMALKYGKYVDADLEKPFDPDSHNTYKTNASPKINILMSESIGQRQNFSLEYIKHQNILKKNFVFFV